MSFENVPCASPDADGQEEPAPSLYGLDNSHDDKIRSMKKPSAPPRLAETANIEDHVIMNEEEIAQVRESVALMARREMYGENRSTSSEKKDEMNERKSYPRERWIDLNLPNTKRNGYGADSRSNNAEVPMNEFAERSASVIKRTTHEGISPDNENRKLRNIEKEEYLKLHCTEKLGNDGSTSLPRGYYYNYPHEEMKALPHVRESKDDYDSDSERGSQKNQDQHAVPRVFFMHPNASIAHGGHLLHTRFSDNRFIHPSQRADYAANRPEQQVPVANSPADSNEHSTRLTGLSGHGGMQFVDRQAFMQQFAMLPGIGPVRVVDGMYYSTIPMGHDSNHYENFGAVPTYVPGVQNEVTTLHQQRQANVTKPGSVKAESAQTHGQHNQDKLSNNKPFGAQNHSKPTSPLPEEVKQNETQTTVKTDRDSPAPSSYEEEKKSQTIKHKGRPRPLPGSKPEIKCEQCGKIFGSSSALAKHKLTHSDERRYVCPICSKGFKRQDHLNGHMVTHRDKKPYECSYQDCDKSYCDMRSLRRHLENHHTSGQTGGDAGSRTASPALTVSEPNSNNTTPVNETPRVVFKPGRGRPPKDRTLKLDGHDGVECESGKSSGTSTPGSTHEVVVVRDQTTMVTSRERSSDSFSSTGSEDVTHIEKHTETRPTSLAVPIAVDDAKKHTAIDMLKQAAERAQEQRDKQSVERFPQQQQYVVYPDGTIPYPPQWYQASVFTGQDPRLNAVYQYPQIFAQQVYHHGTPMIINNANIQRHAIPARIYAEGDKHNEQAKHQAKVTQRSPSVEFPQATTPQGQFVRQAAGTPTDPTAIAVATAKDRGQQLFTREGYYGVHPSGTQWQQVRYDDSSTPYIKQENNTMGNTKTSFTHVRSPSNSSTSSEIDGDGTEHYQRGIHYAPGIRHDVYDRKPVETNYTKKDNTFHHVPEGKSPSEEQKNEGKDEGIFRNPSEIVTPRAKQRRKPEPLTIPASVSTAYQSNHPVPGSPPYTPPPMLSPRSFYSHVNAAGSLTPRSGIPQLPMTPSRLLLSSRSCRSSVDTGEEEVVFPEPKINIGSQFQAKIPDRVLPKEMAKNDVHKATIVWNLLDEKKKGRTQEIQAFLEMSASCAVHGGGSNKEYALHILQKTRGNIKEAVKLLLSKKYVRSPTDPMYDYHYEGSVKWSARERQSFRNAFRSKSKDFNDLQKEIRTKSVADCIEFYYLWKANNPEAVRGRTRYVDSDSEDDYEDDTGSETNSNPSLFECDFPHCSAKFVSRQALNGHIRVHGGSFMKPNEPRKRRAPATTTNQDGETEVVKRPRKPYVPQPMPQPLVEGGPLPEYACKVCGRIFHKIKSRSAHMKTHVKRPDDDHKHDMQH